MKKLRNLIKRNRIFLASTVLTVIICLPRLAISTSPASAEEFLLLNLIGETGYLPLLRFTNFALILLNLTLVYGLLSNWFGKRRAGLSSFVLASIPVWLLMQMALPRFTLVLTPLLVALWSFDRAGRSDKRAALWYALSGIATTAAWLQEPVGVTISMVLCTLLLIGLKPRYAKHIARQASLVLIILVATLAAVSAAAWKFDLGAQDYIVNQLSSDIVLSIIPKLYLQGPSTYHFGLPGLSLMPLAITVLAGLGVWQLVVARKRPRNLYLVILPLLLAPIAIQFTGLTALLLLSLTMVGISTWAVMGVQYLHVSWQRVFPRNKLANSVGDLLIALMITSLALYSFWYINRAWVGNPQTRIDAGIEWSGGL